MESLRRITGRSDFIYVSDAKLCTREQMGYISKEGGRFISVLPETRKERSWFKTWFRSHKVDWEEVVRRPESSEHVYWGYPLYPEGRMCKYPTTITIYHMYQLHRNTTS